MSARLAWAVALWSAAACGATSVPSPSPPSTPSTPSTPAATAPTPAATAPTPAATAPTTMVSLAALPAPSNARIAPPGTFHVDEAPGKKGKRALALCGDELVSTTLRSQRVRDDVTGGDDAQAVRVACDAAWFVTGYAGLRPGPVTNLVDVAGAAALGPISIKRTADHRHVVARSAGGEVVLVAGGEEDIVDVVFAGDLNGDGALDVVVRGSGENQDSHFLFVSQATGALALAAWHKTTGC